MVKLSKASGITCIARLETKASDKSQTCVRAARWQPTRLLSRCRRWLATATTSTARVALGALFVQNHLMTFLLLSSSVTQELDP